jgi:RHS repeat-associated protein
VSLQGRGGRRLSGSRSCLPVARVGAGLVCLLVVLVVGLGVARSDGAGGRGVSAESRSLGHVVGRVASDGGVSLRSSALSARVQRSVLARAARRRRWLESPAARAQRVASRMAFHGLSAGGSRALLLRDYGGVLAGVSASPAASVARAGRVVRYLGDYRAVVRGAGGLRVVSSTTPLVVGAAGSRRPVDLGLHVGSMGFAPVTPLVGLSVARDAAGGVAVGGSGLRLTLEGADASGSVVGGRSVFFPGVGVDMDASVVPTVNGAELFAVLRSRLSPEQIRYRVALPTGSALLEDAGGAAVWRGGAVIARILPPSARDAQGSVVPVAMQVLGDELVLSVSHRRADVAYPVLVDPYVTEEFTGASGGWYFNGSPSITRFRWDDDLLTVGAEVSFPLHIETECCGVETYNSIAGQWTLNVGKGLDASKVEFLDMTGFTAASNESGETPSGALWVVKACDRETGFTHEPVPSSLTYSMGVSACSETPWFIIGLKLGSGIPYESVSASGLISVGSILLTYVPSSEEEEEYGAEKYGASNKGEPDEQDCLLGHPVNCATGNQVETQNDLSVGGRGLGLSLTRTYNSLLAAHQTSHGSFGFGWTSSYSANIHFATNIEGGKVATVYQDNGSAVRFEFNPINGKWVASNPLAQSTLVDEGSNYVYTLPNQTKLIFNSEGRLTSESDRDGNSLTMSYTGGRLESISDSVGRKITLAYNSEGLVESAKDPMGHTVKYTYESGNLASVTQPGEAKLRWKFKYNAAHELTSETDGRENTVATEYEGDRVSSQTDAMSRKRTWKYATTEAGSETTITEPNGSTTVEKFNLAGQLVNVTRASGTSIAATTTYEYNGFNELVAVTDPNKHKTEYGYDAAGNRTSEKDADGDETKWKYDSTHDVEAVTTPDGETTTIEREAHGNPEVIERPAPGGTTQKTTYKYDAYGDVESMTNSLEQTWKYEYDSYGDRKSAADPEGNKRTWEYNEDSQEVAEVSPRGNAEGAEASKFTTKVERDAQGRPLKITDPLGHTTKYTYDGDGNVETVTDGNSHKTTYTYNDDNELIKVKEANGTVTETEYDSMGQVTSQTDGNKHVTKYVRNLLEEVEEVVNPLGKKTLKEYDAAGDLVKLTDAKGRTTTCTYDPAGRLTEVSYSSGSPSTIKYEYNKDGDRTKMTDGTGTTTDTYDQLDRMTESENGHKEVIKYEYNLGNEQIKITYPSGKAVERAFGKDGRLEKVTDWNKKETKFAYDQDSDLKAITFPSETKDEDTYAYNDADQMTEVKMKKSSETLGSLVYTRDNDGQVKKTTAKDLPGAEVTENTYDENNRLTKSGSTEYKYDAANNPTTEGPSTNTYNEGDELEKGTGVTYSYDELGERTKTTPEKGPATTYGYDQASNLTSVERPKEGEVAEIKDTYASNGEGLRTSQTISGTTNYYAWDMTEELPLILSDGTNSYIYGPGGLPVEQINNSTGAVQYLHHDQQGSTRLLTGSTGKVEGKCTYSAYGVPTCEGSATTPLGYDGQYTSSDTGLIYLRHRVYDPSTAQFLSVDPLVLATHEPYVYAGDNPLNYKDRSGLGIEEVFEGPSIPCPWCEAAEATAEALEGAYHAAQHGAEVVLSEIGPEELSEPREQGAGAAEKGCELLEKDKTGRVHGDIPSYPNPEWTEEDLEQVAEDLRDSIEQRKQNLGEGGEEPGHRNKLGEQERLLRQIEKRLSGS